MKALSRQTGKQAINLAFLFFIRHCENIVPADQNQ
jgi:hypothetical protein